MKSILKKMFITLFAGVLLVVVIGAQTVEASPVGAPADYTESSNDTAVLPYDYSVAPVVWSNLSHSNVTWNAAYLSVNITKTGSVSRVGYYLGKNTTINMSQICSWSVGNTLTFCTCQIGGSGNEANIALQPDTTYYYKAFVIDRNGIYW